VSSSSRDAIGQGQFLRPDLSFWDSYWRSPISGKCKEKSRASLRQPTIAVRLIVSVRGVEAATLDRLPMHSLMPEERRRSPRRRLYRAAKIKVGVGILAHDCILIDISERGARLYIAGFDVPDEFVLLLSGDGVVRESKYKVVWRRGHEVGVEFVSVVRSGFALQN
jgi:hypothetical protein